MAIQFFFRCCVGGVVIFLPNGQWQSVKILDSIITVEIAFDPFIQFVHNLNFVAAQQVLH